MALSEEVCPARFLVHVILIIVKGVPARFSCLGHSILPPTNHDVLCLS
jgi:hypothetical protein